MNRLTRLKVVVAAVALVVWAVGARLGDERLTWAGLALLAGAFLLRFLNPRDRM
ncbi:MAG TPA: hypothetical protein VGE02_12270 [Gemmatimonadales bacterium]